jgi:HEAT repeat protein
MFAVIIVQSLIEERCAMNNPTQQLILDLDTDRSPEGWLGAANSLAQIGEPAVPDLLHYVISPNPYKTTGRRYKAIKVLQMMGYPANRSAIHFMVSQVSWINSPGWDDSLEVMKNIGEPVIPAVRQALKLYKKDLYEYSIEIKGICLLLEQMSKRAIAPLVPDLLYLLENGTDENRADEFALWPLRKIGSPKADAAIPVLGEIIASQRKEATRNTAIQALGDFAVSAVLSLIPVLRRCLDDESEKVRRSARRILDSLGEID